jgi:hypothetical protein
MELCRVSDENISARKNWQLSLNKDEKKPVQQHRFFTLGMAEFRAISASLAAVRGR